MSRQRKWRLVVMVVLVLAVVLVAVFQKQIRIAYHSAKIRDGGRFMLYQQGKAPKLDRLEYLWMQFGHQSSLQAELDDMQSHAQALMDLGYLIREEFPLHSRLYAESNRLVFHQKMTNAFSFGTWEAVEGDYWDMIGTQSNKFVITATKDLMPRWRKLIEDFDRP